MKNGRTLPHTAAGQTALVRGLAEKGICGIVVGLDSATPELTPSALSLADELGFPVLLVPYSVGFAAIGRAVAGGAESDDSRRIAVTERVYQVIRQSVNRQGAENALVQLSRDVACRLAVLDAATGEVALDSSDRVPDGLRQALTDEIAGRGGAVPGVLHVSAGDERALAVEVPDEEPTVLVAYGFRARHPTWCNYSIWRRRWRCSSPSRTCDVNTTAASAPRCWRRFATGGSQEANRPACSPSEACNRRPVLSSPLRAGR